MGWRRQRVRALELAVLQAESAQLQVATLQGELSELHRASARRDIELLSVLSRLAAAADRVQLQIDDSATRHARLSRSIERLAMFALAPPIGTRPIETRPGGPELADQGAGTIIGGSVDPTRDEPSRAESTRAEPAPSIDLTRDLPADLAVELPIAPSTRAEAPLDCEVHLQFGDRWIDGFQIEETIRAGAAVQFRLRRQVDGWVLPELFDECEVRVFTRPVVETT